MTTITKTPTPPKTSTKLKNHAAAKDEMFPKAKATSLDPVELSARTAARKAYLLAVCV